jgi:hypothetical protein
MGGGRGCGLHAVCGLRRPCGVFFRVVDREEFFKMMSL